MARSPEVLRGRPRREAAWLADVSPLRKRNAPSSLDSPTSTKGMAPSAIKTGRLISKPSISAPLQAWVDKTAETAISIYAVPGKTMLS